MKREIPDGVAADEVRTTLASVGFSLVELAIQRVKKRTHVRCVVYHPDGFDLDRLTEIHRLIEPRLEIILDDRDMYIEFSSPGIDRTFKSFHEFGIFSGQRVSVLLEDQRWIDATIESYEESRVALRRDDGETAQYEPDQIVKARLSN